MKEIQVEEKYIGVRMDRYLRKEYTNLSLGEIFKALRTGKIKVNGKKCKEKYRLAEGDLIQSYLGEVEKKEKTFMSLTEKEKASIAARIHYEEESFLVFYKKAGELMHKGSGHDYGLAEALQAYYQNEDLHFVNRLDKGTSGLVLAGKNLQTVRNFAEKIREREVEKRYYIIVEGEVKKKAFQLISYMKKGDEKMLARKEKEEDYKECSASFEVLAKNQKYTLLEANLETGRTHQLRVQLAEEGHPIVGEGKYAKSQARRLYLHSHLLRLGEQEWDTGLPKEFTDFLESKGVWYENNRSSGSLL